jgi:hypothetical protein
MGSALGRRHLQGQLDVLLALWVRARLLAGSSLPLPSPWRARYRRRLPLRGDGPHCRHGLPWRLVPPLEIVLLPQRSALYPLLLHALGGVDPWGNADRLLNGPSQPPAD